MAVEYGADVTNPAYTYSNIPWNRYSLSQAYGELFVYSYATSVFNNIAASSSFLSMRDNGFGFNTEGTIQIWQNFGVDNKKHIRKIRYQYFRKNNGVGTPEATWQIHRYKNSTWISLGTFNVVTNDTGWNEILLPKTEACEAWRITFTASDHGTVYPGEIWTGLGEIEMMEGVDIANSVAFFL